MISWQSAFSFLVLLVGLLYYPKLLKMKTTTGVITAELNDTYDYIIVGGGTAGSVLAARLSEEGNSTVLLLEAGGDYTENSMYHIPSAIGMFEHSDADWQFLTDPQEHSLKGMNDRRSYWAAGRVLGGGSVLNYLLYTRGLAADYNSWAEMGCDGWGFDSVLPYFLKSEDILASDLKNSEFHGKGGPIGVSDGKISDLHEYFIKAGIEAGFEHKDYNDMVGESVSSMLITTRKGMRSSTGLEYLGRINGRNNLHVAVNSFVTKLRLVNKKAKGVYVIRDGRKRLVTARREVVMSAGAINTPVILMHSGIGSKHHLEKVGIKAIVDLPVGQNLQNHFFALMKTTNQSKFRDNDGEFKELENDAAVLFTKYRIYVITRSRSYVICLLQKVSKQVLRTRLTDPIFQYQVFI